MLLSLHKCRWADGLTATVQMGKLRLRRFNAHVKDKQPTLAPKVFCALEYSLLCLAFSCLPSPPSSFSFRLEMKGKEQRKLRPLSALETTDSQTRQNPGSVCMQNSTPESLNPSLWGQPWEYEF